MSDVIPLGREGVARHRWTVGNQWPAANSLYVGEIAVGLADPMQLWVGVPTSLDPSGIRLLYDAQSATEAPADGQIYGRRGSTASWQAVLPLTGGTLSGPLVVPNGTIASPGLQLGAADGTGISRASNALVFSVQGSTILGTFAGAAQFYGPLAMLGNKITQLADATAASDALNLRVADGRYATPANIPLASTQPPLMDSAAAPGSSAAWSPGDHVHPSDTSRLALTGGTLTGDVTITAAHNLNFQAASITTAQFHSDANWGIIIQGLAGSQADVALFSRSGSPQLKISGTGTVTINGVTIDASGVTTLVGAPTAAQHAATKQYVDGRTPIIADAASNSFSYGRNNAAWVQVPSITGVPGNAAWDPNAVPTTGIIGFYQITNQTGAPNWPADNPDQTALVLQGYNSNAGWQTQLMMGGRGRNQGPPIWYRSFDDEFPAPYWSPWYRLFSTAGGTITGATTFSSTVAVGAAASFAAGVSFGSTTGASAADLSKHIALWGTSYGISITPNRLNLVCGGGNIVFCLGNTDIAYFAAGGLMMDGANTVTLGADPTTALQAATKQYVDAVRAAFPVASSTLPIMDGPAAVGTGTTWARADHVHPSDTSRAPLASPIFSGNPTAPSPPLGDTTASIPTTSWVAQSATMATYQTGGTFDFNTVAAGAPTVFHQFGGPLTTANGPPPYSIAKGTLLEGYAANPGFSFQLFLTDTGNTADQGLWWRQMNGQNNWTTNAVWHRILTDQGGTLTGALTLVADPTTALGAATKQYVDALRTLVTGSYLPLVGGSMSGGINFGTMTATSPTDLSKHLNLWNGPPYGLSITSGRLNIVSGSNVVCVIGSVDVATFGATGLLMAASTAITLAADPTTAMQAVTKQYVDSRVGGTGYLALTGGTLTGTLTFATPSVTGATSTNKGYLIEQDLTYSLPANASGIYFGNEFNAVVSGNPPSGAQVWHNFDRVFAQTASTSSAAIVNRYIQTVRPGGYGAPGQVMWGAVMELRDQTGLPSSQAGGILGLEIDIACNGADDANNRQGLTITFLNGTGSGASPQAKQAIGIFSGGDGAAYFKSIIQLAVPFHDAAIDFRNAGFATGGTTHGLWMRSGMDIAFDVNGSFLLSTDGTFLNSSQRLNSPNGFAIGGAGSIITADGVAIAVSLPLRVPTYTVAGLPSMGGAEHGSVAFASNALNSGQAAGSGTGCLVYLDSAAIWRSVWTGLPASTSVGYGLQPNGDFTVQGNLNVGNTINSTGNINSGAALFAKTAVYVSYPTAQTFYLNGDGTNNIISFQSGYYFAWSISNGLLQYVANNASAMQIDYQGNATFTGTVRASGGGAWFGNGGNGRVVNFAPSWYLDWNATNGTLTWVCGGPSCWWADGSQNLTIANNCYALAFVQTSDARLKKNVQPWVERGLADVVALQPVSFQYNGEGDTTDDGVTRYGVIAQDAQECLPEAVHIMPSSERSLSSQLAFDNGVLIVAMVNAIKQLAERVEMLEAA